MPQERLPTRKMRDVLRLSAGGFAGPNLLAMILFEKFGQHQPLNRHSERYAREGIDLGVSTLADQVGACTSVLQPLYELIEAHVLGAERLHGDDDGADPGEGQDDHGPHLDLCSRRPALRWSRASSNTKRTFGHAADQFEKEYAVITEGQRSPRSTEGHKARLRIHLLPFLWRARLIFAGAQGEVQALRVMQQQAMRVGMRRVELRMRMAQLEGRPPG